MGLNGLAEIGAEDTWWQRGQAGDAIDTSQNCLPPLLDRARAVSAIDSTRYSEFWLAPSRDQRERPAKGLSGCGHLRRRKPGPILWNRFQYPAYGAVVVESTPSIPASQVLRRTERRYSDSARSLARTRPWERGWWSTTWSRHTSGPHKGRSVPVHASLFSRPAYLDESAVMRSAPSRSS